MKRQQKRNLFQKCQNRRQDNFVKPEQQNPMDQKNRRKYNYQLDKKQQQEMLIILDKLIKGIPFDDFIIEALRDNSEYYHSHFHQIQTINPQQRFDIKDADHETVHHENINHNNKAKGHWFTQYYQDKQNIWDQSMKADLAIIVLQGRVDLFTDIKDKNGNVIKIQKYVKSLTFKQFFADEGLHSHQELNFKTRAIAVDSVTTISIKKHDYFKYYYNRNLHSEFIQKFHVLEQLDIFIHINQKLSRDVKHDIFHHLYSLMDLEEVQQNKILYYENQPVDYVYIIKEGKIQFEKKIKHSDQENEISVKLSQLESGCFGLEEIFKEKNKRIQSAKCISSVAQIYKIKINYFQDNFIWYMNKMYNTVLQNRCEKINFITNQMNKYLSEPKYKNPYDTINEKEQITAGLTIYLNQLNQRSKMSSFQDIVNDKLEFIRHHQTMNYNTPTNINKIDQQISEIQKNKQASLQDYLHIVNENQKELNKIKDTSMPILSKLLKKKEAQSNSKNDKNNQSQYVMKKDYIKQICAAKGKATFDSFQQSYLQKLQVVYTDYNEYNFFQHKLKRDDMNVSIDYKKLDGLHKTTEALYNITNQLFEHSDQVRMQKVEKDLRFFHIRPKIFL